ncbi:MAG: family 78 glycoside hydrolase catalytic domain [Rikenellaceae bacterium]
MKKKLITLFTLSLALLPFVQLNAADKSPASYEFNEDEAKIYPFGLRVDYIRNPELTTINSENPMFSWQLNSGAISQTSYQVLVSSSKSELEAGLADMWDSGQVTSNECSAVVYGGKPLQADTKYYWKVRFWDYSKDVSEYSYIQEFKMAAQTEEKTSIVSDNPVYIRKDSYVGVKKVADNHYQFDYGKAAFGNIFFEYKSAQDDTLCVRIGEQLDSTGRLETKPKGTIRFQELRVPVKAGEFVYEAIFKTDKRNTGVAAIPIPDSMGVIMPFRYVELYGYTNNVNDFKPTRRVLDGYKEDIGKFSSSNQMLDDIWEICKYTIQATDFLGYYIDGDRERIPYEADAYINQLCHYAIDAEYAIGKKSLEYFMSHATWPTEWLLHTTMIAYQDYYYTGDTRIIEKYFEKLKLKSLHELAREDGLISAKNEIITKDYMKELGYTSVNKPVEDIVDWPMAAFTKTAKEMGERDDHEMMPYNTVVNCFFYYSMTVMSEMAAVIGRDDESVYFAEMAEKVKNTINEKLFDAEKGIYIDGEGSTHSSLHSNMMPLAFDMVPEEHVQSVADFVESRGLRCSVYGSQYLFEALYKAGKAQYALDLMTNTTDRSWYNMIKIGSTMTLEAWDIKYKANLDWNHAWGATPANLISRMMWGITPTAPAFKKAVVKPQLADLTSSEIVVPTLLGDISGKYKATKSKKVYEIVVPANMQAVFEVVEDGDVSVKYNGDKLPKNTMTIELKVGKNTIEIR